MGSDEYEHADGPRTVLLDAAYHPISEYGDAEFSLHKVADEAGTSRELVHANVESKTDLLRSLLE
jgi:AcrR family transcriptional regulator